MGVEGIRGTKGHIPTTDFVEVFREMKALDKLDSEEDQDSETKPRSVVSLPHGLANLSEFYTTAESDSILKPWEIVTTSNSLYKPITLDSGEEISTAELKMTEALFGRLKARRSKQGVLEIWDGDKYQPFTNPLFRKLSGLNPTSKESGKLISLEHNGLGFVQKCMPKLLETGVLQAGDFKVQGGSTTSEVFNVSERKLNPRSQVQFANFTTSQGHSAKYFLGRKILVGTEETMDMERMRVRLLDSTIAGITEERHGKKVLKYVFSLMTDEEIKNKHEQLFERGQKDLASNTVANKQEMEARMRPYSITDYVPQRSNENSTQYAERVAKLSDVGFVTEKFQQFFSEAGIGVHKLPWSEQLVLAYAILEEKSRDRLIGFGKKYGLTGVRSFLSLDLDRGMGEHILELGEKGEQKIVAEIFKKYAAMVDSAKQVESYVTEKFGSKIATERSGRIRENLLVKAKDVLQNFDPAELDSLEAVNVITELEKINENILLFAATIRETAKDESVSVEDFVSKSMEILDSSALNEDDKRQMLAMFKVNRKRAQFPDDLAEKTTETFIKNLNEPGHQFRLLKDSGNVIGFIGVDFRPDGSVYVHGFNLDPNAKGTSVAIAMAKTGLEEIGKGHDIDVKVYEKNPILSFYKMLGFKQVGEPHQYEGFEDKYVILKRPKAGKKLEQQTAEQAPTLQSGQAA